jgi:N-acyl-D-amino-acid deacylase
VGLNLSTNPFAACPSYRALADLPLHERVAEMRKPEVRRRIVDEDPTGNVLPLVLASRQFDQTYVITDPPTYEPAPELSVEAIAAARGVSTAEMAYDLLLEDDGEAMLYVALANYGYRNLDHVAELFARPDTVIGLGDGGAHYGMICDGSYPTFVLTHWAHDRSGTQISLAEAVRMLAAVPAGTVGLRDRGVLAPGLKADVNVIDLERLRMHPPTVAFDLPSGGRRIKQLASGYRWTFVSGQPILRDDEMTGELPGKLVRGVRSA